MTDAPKRIYMARNGGLPTGNYPENMKLAYDLTRPGQPCSDLEFMQRLQAAGTPPNGYVWLVARWVRGDFTAAMEGLK